MTLLDLLSYTGIVVFAASGASAGLFVLLIRLGPDAMTAGIMGAAAGFALRGGALHSEWTLPGYREQHGH